MTDLLILNGPNLNLLGNREPQHYGSASLDSINTALESRAREKGYSLAARQSNSESELVELVHQASVESVRFIIINPAAYTHTSVALRDALAAVDIPFIEVHLSNIYAREPFRTHSYFSDIAAGVISGLGAHGYILALDAAIHRLDTTSG
ncbi:MAG: 3-dehydroquinate dehydratase 1 [marine bacterium B5-7]|nr:MAG: 3-dehydroquinate dehydratase 1 [marine bacterium B5-7]